MLFFSKGKTTKSIQLKTRELEFKETPSYFVNAVSEATLTCSAYGNPVDMQGGFYNVHGKRYLYSSVTKSENLFTAKAKVSNSGHYRCEIRNGARKIDFTSTVQLFESRWNVAIHC